MEGQFHRLVRVNFKQSLLARLICLGNIRKIARMRYRILVYICLILGVVGLPSAFPAKSDEPIIQWQLTQYWPHSRESSLWKELSKRFTMDHHIDQKAVQKQITFLSRRQDYINELSENARPYLYYIYLQTQKHNMPAEIALVPMIESDYNPFGISRTGATGLWQMMPGTASGLGLQIDWWYDGRRNIIKSTDAALKHLRYLHAYFGTWPLALAAYDSGDGTVRAAIRYNKKRGRPTDFWHLPLPTETKRYVPKLLALAAVIADRKHYGLRLKAIPNQPYFAAIKMKGQIELKRVAKLSNTALKMVRKLNPAFRRWTTTPKRAYWLILPENNAATFRKNLVTTKNTKTTWIHHHVKSGETLSQLATTNHTTTNILQGINHLKRKTIHTGQEILIPRYYHGKFSTLKKQKALIAEDKIPGPKRSVHVVKSNETLSSIAAQHHVTPGQIRFWNQISYHHPLKPNQKLVIWNKHRYVKSGSHRYTVQKNDSLSRIASRFQTTSHNIMRLNNLKTSVLQIGQKLKISYPNINHKTYKGKRNNKLIIHTVRPGQSLSVVAHYYHVPTHKIVVWNNLQKQKLLHVGEKLKIYLN